TLGSGRLRGEERAHAVTGRGREAEALHRDIEIELVQPRTVLHGIYHAQARFNTERTEILDVRRMMGLQRWFIHQELDLERLAVRQQSLAVLYRATSIAQQLRRGKQVLTILPR